MNVYVVEKHWPYESDQVLGVFARLVSAQDEASIHNERPVEFKREGAQWSGSAKNGYDFYTVTRMKVRGRAA